MNDDLLTDNALDQSILADMLTAITGTLIGAEVELYQNDVPLVKNRPLADFDLCDYTGYAAEAVTWNAPSIADDGSIEVTGVVGEFRPTDAVTPNSAYGLILTNGGVTKWGATRFTTAPIPMASTLDAYTPTIRVRVNSSGVVVSVS